MSKRAKTDMFETLPLELKGVVASTLHKDRSCSKKERKRLVQELLLTCGAGNNECISQNTQAFDKRCRMDYDDVWMSFAECNTNLRAWQDTQRDEGKSDVYESNNWVLDSVFGNQNMVLSVRDRAGAIVEFVNQKHPDDLEEVISKYSWNIYIRSDGKVYFHVSHYNREQRILTEMARDLLLLIICMLVENGSSWPDEQFPTAIAEELEMCLRFQSNFQTKPYTVRAHVTGSKTEVQLSCEGAPEEAPCSKQST